MIDISMDLVNAFSIVQIRSPLFILLIKIVVFFKTILQCNDIHVQVENQPIKRKRKKIIK